MRIIIIAAFALLMLSGCRGGGAALMGLGAFGQGYAGHGQGITCATYGQQSYRITNCN